MGGSSRIAQDRATAQLFRVLDSPRLDIISRSMLLMIGRILQTHCIGLGMPYLPTLNSGAWISRVFTSTFETSRPRILDISRVSHCGTSAGPAMLHGVPWYRIDRRRPSLWYGTAARVANPAYPTRPAHRCCCLAFDPAPAIVLICPVAVVVSPVRHSGGSVSAMVMGGPLNTVDGAPP